MRQVRVTKGSVSDDCDQTDGIAATTAPLGSSFPGGLFVCQDGFNQYPTQFQSFKYTPLETILP